MIMAIENIEDYWRGEPNFGLRRRIVIEVDTTGTGIEKIVPNQKIIIEPKPLDKGNSLCSNELEMSLTAL